MSTWAVDWGEVTGRPVKLYGLANRRRMVARISTYGAALVQLQVPDREGNSDDVVLGYDTLASYLVNGPRFGVVIGRVGNRIRDARFEIDGEDYQLNANDGSHHLHGGWQGFSHQPWDSRAGDGNEGPWVELSLRSLDGDEGYPGELLATARYTLSHDGELRLDLRAVANRPTPVNLIHHPYWNLAGHDAGDISEQVLGIAARYYTPVDEELIPTGEIESVAETPFDLTRLSRVGVALDRLRGEKPPHATGFDVNYVVIGQPGQPRLASRLIDHKSGRELQIETTAPGIQLYTGNDLEGERGKGGARYERHGGLCLEPQIFPDAIHHLGEPGWPDGVLRPGGIFRSQVVYRFLVLS